MNPAAIALSRAGDLIAALGSAQFPGRLWCWLCDALEPHSCHTVATRYRRRAPSRCVDGVDLLFFAGEIDPDDTRHALDLYLGGDWRADTILPYVERLTDPQIVFSSNHHVSEATAYGRYFTQGELGEECTLLGSDYGEYVYALSLFRRRGEPSFTLDELSRMRQLGDFLLPLLVQHARLASVAHHSAQATLAQRFEQRLAGDGVALSQRERLVCCALLEGRQVAQIAQTLEVEPCSVRTYLGRALAKLGVANRAGLFAWTAGGAIVAGTTGPA
ncbi:helix-turn-helix transcriptional regulator [Paraburkholderia ferrariae]|uniref:helix-turn-helix transcriptional regulator n=1 Tax=Paraburkholderia ferrariae TaxID=386056 RepID=UPI0006937067|nr:LuxR C-terminal-related transcriptional regulator [Paraburkholderia ferrariae]